MLVLAAALISLLISIKIDGHLWITNSNNGSKLFEAEVEFESNLISFIFWSKLYTPSTLNIDHTQLIVCAANIKSWFKSWGFHFTFQAYTMPHTLNCMYICLLAYLNFIFEF